MFIKTSGFKRLITSAYNGSGLHVANDGEGLILHGLMWSMWIRSGHLPKKSLGDLIALTGELPERNQAFVATKKEFQWEAIAAYPDNAMKMAESCNAEMDPTRVLMVSTTFVRLLQNDEAGLMAINEAFYRLIDAGAVEEGEDTPKGPIVKLSEGHGFNYDVGVCWYNDDMAISFRYGETNQVEKEMALLEGHHIARTSEII